jgi:mannose-1-phosphate guanylyltransferase
MKIFDEISSRVPVRCGIVLAGGNGKRLAPFIRHMRGDDLPKQYVNLSGSRSMLEHTFHRAEKLISPEHLFTVVGRNHLKYPEARRQLLARPEGTIVVQPENKETAPGLLLPLMHLYKRYPKSTVVVFPSDHFIVEEDLFMLHVHRAFRLAEQDPSRLVLLGVEPSAPEPEYGYIMPGKKRQNLLASVDAREVSQFIEKPAPRVAHELILRGGLWNTMVMVFTVDTLLNAVYKTAPQLYDCFQNIGKAIGTSSAADIMEKTYKVMWPVNLSREVLEVISRQKPSPLWVLPVRGVSWSDWGSKRRIEDTLKETEHLIQKEARKPARTMVKDGRQDAVEKGLIWSTKEN